MTAFVNDIVIVLTCPHELMEVGHDQVMTPNGIEVIRSKVTVTVTTQACLINNMRMLRPTVL